MLLHPLCGGFDAANYLFGFTIQPMLVPEHQLVAEGADLTQWFLQIMRSYVGKLPQFRVGPVELQQLFLQLQLVPGTHSYFPVDEIEGNKCNNTGPNGYGIEVAR